MLTLDHVFIIFGEYPSVWILTMLFLGMLFGSFIGCISYRLANKIITESQPEMNVHSPSTWHMLMSRSQCPHCQSIIPFYHNIPLFSWLYLKGKCFVCKQQISIRYFLIELQFTLCFVLMAVFLIPSFETVLIIVFTCFVWTLFWTDLEHYLLPDVITITMLWCGLLINLNDHFIPLRQAVLGAIFGYTSLWFVDAIFRVFRKKQGIGKGDFKFFAALGAWLGIKLLPFILLSASFLAIIVTIAIILIRKISNSSYNQAVLNKETIAQKLCQPEKIELNQNVPTMEIAIPFGAYLAVTSWFILLYLSHFNKILF